MAGTPVAGSAPRSSSASSTANSGKRKRLAPTNLGDSETFHHYAKKAKGMSEEERKKERASLQLQLAALTKVEMEESNNSRTVELSPSSGKVQIAAKTSTTKAPSSPTTNNRKKPSNSGSLQLEFFLPPRKIRRRCSL